MQIFEMFNEQHKSCGYFSMEEIKIMSDMYDIYDYSDNQLNEYLSDANLVYELEQYIEQIPDDENKNIACRGSSLAEMEGYSVEVVLGLINKIKELNNDDVKLMIETVFSAKKFFNTFLSVDNPLKELNQLRKKSNVFKEGYYSYKKSFEELQELNAEVNDINRELIEMVKDNKSEPESITVFH